MHIRGHTVDGRNPAPPKKPLNDDSFVKYQQTRDVGYNALVECAHLTSQHQNATAECRGSSFASSSLLSIGGSAVNIQPLFAATELGPELVFLLLRREGCSHFKQHGTVGVVRSPMFLGVHNVKFFFAQPLRPFATKTWRMFGLKSLPNCLISEGQFWHSCQNTLGQGQSNSGWFASEQG